MTAIEEPAKPEVAGIGTILSFILDLWNTIRLPSAALVSACWCWPALQPASPSGVHATRGQGIRCASVGTGHSAPE
jgi:hypothetical protein